VSFSSILGFSLLHLFFSTLAVFPSNVFLYSGLSSPPQAMPSPFSCSITCICFSLLYFPSCCPSSSGQLVMFSAWAAHKCWTIEPMKEERWRETVWKVKEKRGLSAHRYWHTLMCISFLFPSLSKYYIFSFVECSQASLKGYSTQKWKFCHHLIQFLSSAEHKGRYFKEQLKLCWHHWLL